MPFSIKLLPILIKNHLSFYMYDISTTIVQKQNKNEVSSQYPIQSFYLAFS